MYPDDVGCWFENGINGWWTKAEGKLDSVFATDMIAKTGQKKTNSVFVSDDAAESDDHGLHTSTIV